MKKWKFVGHTNLVFLRNMVSFLGSRLLPSAAGRLLEAPYYLILGTCPPRRVMSNAERPVKNEEGGRMYEVPNTLDTRCKKQEIRLSSVDMKILP